MVERLPVVSSDIGTWGGILNEFLEVAHNADGTLKDSPGAGRPTSKTLMLMEWGPPVPFPDSTFGYGAVDYYTYLIYDALEEFKAAGIYDGFAYTNFHEVSDFAGPTGYDPSHDPQSDLLACPLRYEFLLASLGSGVFMKEGGVDIITPSFGTRIARLGDPGIQRYMALAQRAKCRRLGVRRIFVDVFNTFIVSTGGIVSLPDGIADENQWENEHVYPFARNVFTFLRNAGIKVYINGTGGDDGYHAGGSFNRGDHKLAWMHKLAPFVDGFFEEYAYQGSDADPMDDSLALTGEAIAVNGYKSWWSGHRRHATAAFSLGKAFFPLAHTHRTYADGASGLDAATIAVLSTAQFPTAGTLCSPGDGELFTYTGKTGTTFTGCAAHAAIANGQEVTLFSGHQLRFVRGSGLLDWDGKSEFAAVNFCYFTIADTTPSYKWDTGYPLGNGGGALPSRQINLETLTNGAAGLDSATITVDSTTGFETAGEAFADGVGFFTYTGKTGTTLTGCSAHAAIGDNIAIRSTLSYMHCRQFDNGTLVGNTDPTTAHVHPDDPTTTSVPARDFDFIVGEWF